MITLNDYLLVSGLLFAIGLAGVVLRGGEPIPPGGRGLAQLRFNAPVIAHAGQRAILRRSCLLSGTGHIQHFFSGEFRRLEQQRRQRQVCLGFEHDFLKHDVQGDLTKLLFNPANWAATTNLSITGVMAPSTLMAGGKPEVRNKSEPPRSFISDSSC